MKRIIISMVVAIAMMQVSATVQHNEMLNYNGEKVQLYSLLLELNDELYRDVKKRLPKGYRSSLWRNYIGHWKIENDSLFLDSIAVFKDDKLKALNIDDLVLKYRLPDGRIFCSWVSDTLKMGKGESLIFELSIYTNELNVTVNNGIVHSTKSITNRAIYSEFNNNIDTLSTYFPFEKYPSIDNIILYVKPIAFDVNGDPIDYKVNIVRSPKECNQGIKEDIESEVKQIFKIHKLKLFRIYEINNKYIGFESLFRIKKRTNGIRK